MIGTKTILVIAFCLALAVQADARRVTGHRATVEGYGMSESKQQGGGEDDWNEGTDIVRTSNKSSTTHTSADPDYLAKANETIVDIDTDVGESEIVEEVQTRAIINADGSITNEKVTVRVNRTKTIKTFKISTFWSKSYKIDSVKSVVIGFVNEYAPEITEKDLDMFNAIGATDGNRFYSAYNYLQVRAENLETVVRASSSILQVKLSEADIQTYITEIRECATEAIIRMPDTAMIDVNRRDSWTIYAEFLAAKCTKNAKGYQLFTFTSSKSGAYRDGVIRSSADLAVAFPTIRNILRPWLWRYAAMMFTCPEAKVQPPSYGNDKPVACDA
jgi:hypothetical protein